MSDDQITARVEEITKEVARTYAPILARMAELEHALEVAAQRFAVVRQRLREWEPEWEAGWEPDYEEVERQRLESRPPQGPEWEDTNGRTP